MFKTTSANKTETSAGCVRETSQIKIKEANMEYVRETLNIKMKPAWDV